MIKPEEIRIGNLVFDYNELFKVNCININADFSNFNPIPLTEEWLLKFGFDKWGDCFGNYYHVYNSFEMENINNYCGVGKNQKILYVHQLQNLYFALTGEELTIKEI